MRVKRFKRFGVDVNSISLEFSSKGPPCAVYDLTRFGLPWIPVIGRVSVNNRDEPVSWHVHKDCTEIIFCRSGKCDYDVEGGSYCLSPGHVLVSRPDEPHRQRANPKGLVTYYLFFRPAMDGGRAAYDEEVRWLDGELRKLPRFFSVGSSVFRTFNRVFSIVADFKGTEVAKRTRLRTLVTSLLLELFDSTCLSVSDEKPEGLRGIVQKMRQHPEMSYSTAGLAKGCSLSVASFLNEFRKETGFTPHVYLVNCRIEKAKRMLRSGQTIDSVADCLGYSSRQHFSSSFKSVTGLPPSAWLAQRDMDRKLFL